MGEPIVPTPVDRRARRDLAMQIVEAVRNDEDVPVPTEEQVFGLAQETTMLYEQLQIVVPIIEVAKQLDMTMPGSVGRADRVLELNRLVRLLIEWELRQ